MSEEQLKAFLEKVQVDTSLQEKLKAGPLEFKEAIDLTCQLCDALGKACMVNVLEGAGKAEPTKDAVSGFDPGAGELRGRAEAALGARGLRRLGLWAADLEHAR